MALSKDERETLDALRAKEQEPPERSERVNIFFDYDPDDAESVKRGLSRGHVTKEDAASWGHDLKSLGIDDDDDDGDDDDDEDREKKKPPVRRSTRAKKKTTNTPPRRRSGYFGDDA